MGGITVERTLLVVTSSPGSAEAMRALAIACARDDQAHTMALVLLQDAVQAAVDGNQTPVAQVVSRTLADGGAVYVAQQDLALRGISPDDLTPQATVVDDRRLVDLMLADGTKTLGCF
jgi:sulfur relay protein TusB/DsrH